MQKRTRAFSLSPGRLRQSQHRDLPVLQAASIAGEYGVSFLVVAGNIAIAEGILRCSWKAPVLTGVVIGLVHLWGVQVLSAQQNGHLFRVAVMQPSVLRGEIKAATGRAAALDRLDGLTRGAARLKPALIVWPETSVRDV